MSRKMIVILLLGFLVPLARGGDLKPFSSLPDADRARLHAMAEPPPTAERTSPYSTPMYYLMHQGYQYLGGEDADPQGRCYPSMMGKKGPDFGTWSLDRNRPDWQETMLRDLAELGMTQTHLNIYPVKGELKLTGPLETAIKDYVRLSAKYGMKVGVRLDAIDETVLWTVHPENPASQRKAYLDWVRQVASCLSGQSAYYILGDELTFKADTTTRPSKSWTPEMYLAYFKEVKAAIREKDPSAKVCMFAASSGEWFNVTSLLANGYAEVGDGVAINHYNWGELSRFIQDRDRLAPGKLFLSSGVGYISNGTVSPRYPEGDAYSKCPSEQSHAAEIARTMYMWWVQRADNAPYYISLRNWIVDGKIYPRWFGFFGFEDYVIDGGVMRVQRHPGWYAYQAVAKTFYDRAACKVPAFGVSSSQPLERFDCFERTRPAGRELLMMLWNDKPMKVRVKLDTLTYGNPVRLSLGNVNDWQDVTWGIEGGATWVELPVDSSPMIIRMFGQ